MSDRSPNGPPDDDPPIEQARQDLRATADSIGADADRLGAIEDQKQALDAADPAIDRLSEEAVALADRISRETRVERQLSKEIG
jgi:hypothetical protein